MSENRIRHVSNEPIASPDDTRMTAVTVDGLEVRVHERYWSDNHRRPDGEWSVLAQLYVSQECETKREVLQNIEDNLIVARVLVFLEYDVYSVDPNGDSIWTKSGAGHDPNN